ncbi:MAG: flagellar motor switch protein FliN [Proteobacteria bacterium]|jgi:flagellar motor switch protein FliN/FliY|nr:flagellar motor switch protein FliN [Pseudomonadota bacterium]
MSERASTASKVAADLLEQLNEKVRSELVSHIDEYFQRTDFQEGLAFQNIPKPSNLAGLRQDSGNSQAIETLETQPDQVADGEKTISAPSSLSENVGEEDQKSNSEQELTQAITSQDERHEDPALENVDSTKENLSSLKENFPENVGEEDQKSNSEKEPLQGTLVVGNNLEDSLQENIDPPDIIDANLFVQEEETPLPHVNVDFLMEMPLKVTFEVGRTRMDIKDLISLGQGSVVELHRFVGEDLDIFVNGKLVARGELVVSKENFGAKISEIISPQDRVKRMGGLAQF